ESNVSSLSRSIKLAPNASPAFYDSKVKAKRNEPLDLIKFSNKDERTVRKLALQKKKELGKKKIKLLFGKMKINLDENKTNQKKEKLKKIEIKNKKLNDAKVVAIDKLNTL